jgi:hypothetical protein
LAPTCSRDATDLCGHCYACFCHVFQHTRAGNTMCQACATVNVVKLLQGLLRGLLRGCAASRHLCATAPTHRGSKGVCDIVGSRTPSKLHSTAQHSTAQHSAAGQAPTTTCARCWLVTHQLQCATDRCSVPNLPRRRLRGGGGKDDGDVQRSANTHSCQWGASRQSAVTLEQQQRRAPSKDT